jgi:hypothetical protein
MGVGPEDAIIGGMIQWFSVDARAKRGHDAAVEIRRQ